MSEELIALRYELGRLAKLVDELGLRDRVRELEEQLGEALVRENNLLAGSKRKGVGVAPRAGGDRDAAGGHSGR